MRTSLICALAVCFLSVCFLAACPKPGPEPKPLPKSRIERSGDSIRIIDLRGEKWDITEAARRGFRPERFGHGVGRDAFAPLGVSDITKDASGIPLDERVIAAAKGKDAMAITVARLKKHETANLNLGGKPVAAGY